MQRDIEQFLTDLKGTPEHDFHSAIVDVVKFVDYDPSSATQGFALLDLISQGELVTDRVNTILSPLGGSIEETAFMVSHLFDAVDQPPIWWKASYPIEVFSKDVQITVDWWVDQLRQVPGVISVER